MSDSSYAPEFDMDTFKKLPTLEKRVCYMHAHEPLPSCSQIDAILGLAPGTAYGIMSANLHISESKRWSDGG